MTEITIYFWGLCEKLMNLESRDWQLCTFFYTHSLWLRLCGNPQKSHLRSLQRCLYEFKLFSWTNYQLQELYNHGWSLWWLGTGNWSTLCLEKLKWRVTHREHALFIEHKIHIASTREGYFLWHSKIRQPEKHAAVCHLGRAPNETTFPASQNPRFTRLLLEWVGMCFW